MDDMTMCIVGQANRELFSNRIGLNTHKFAEGFGLDVDTVNHLYMGRWHNLMGGNFKNRVSLDLVTREQAARLIRAFVKKIQKARKNREVNRARLISMRYGKVEIYES
jgi:hypothetical protein